MKKKLNVFRRCMIFATFFGCLAAGALAALALAVPRWAEARATRTPAPGVSKGQVHFGLFAGRKELNYAYGWRTHDFSVPALVRGEAQLLHVAAWAGTVACSCAGLALAALGALAAAVSTAAAPPRLPSLYLCNCLVFLADMGAVSLWIVEYYTKIQYNVLSPEDQANKWTTEGMADFGRSFWFMVGAAVISCLNIISIMIAVADDRDKDPVQPMIEEKTNGAIMLY